MRFQLYNIFLYEVDIPSYTSFYLHYIGALGYQKKRDGWHNRLSFLFLEFLEDYFLEFSFEYFQ